MSTSNADEFVFHSDKLNYKTSMGAKGKEFFVEGYISTGDMDLVNDIVTKNCMNNMMSQFDNRSIKLDFEHETFRGKSKLDAEANKTRIPLGKAIGKDIDVKGVKVKWQLNPTWKKFDEKGNVVMTFKDIWSNIESEMYDAFSIAYVPTSTKSENREGKSIRLLDDINLLNVALTGNAINPNATMTAVMAKSLEFMKEKEEVKDMDIEIKDSIDKIESGVEELKHKYIKRTGNAGNYKYTYPDTPEGQRARQDGRKPHEYVEYSNEDSDLRQEAEDDKLINKQSDHREQVRQGTKVAVSEADKKRNREIIAIGGARHITAQEIADKHYNSHIEKALSQAKKDKESDAIISKLESAIKINNKESEAAPKKTDKPKKESGSDLKVGSKVNAPGLANRRNVGKITKFQEHNKNRVYVAFEGGGGTYYDLSELKPEKKSEDQLFQRAAELDLTTDMADLFIKSQLSNSEDNNRCIVMTEKKDEEIKPSSVEEVTNTETVVEESSPEGKSMTLSELKSIVENLAADVKTLTKENADLKSIIEKPINKSKGAENKESKSQPEGKSFVGPMDMIA